MPSNLSIWDLVANPSTGTKDLTPQAPTNYKDFIDLKIEYLNHDSIQEGMVIWALNGSSSSTPGGPRIVIGKDKIGDTQALITVYINSSHANLTEHLGSQTEYYKYFIPIHPTTLEAAPTNQDDFVIKLNPEPQHGASIKANSWASVAESATCPTRTGTVLNGIQITEESIRRIKEHINHNMNADEESYPEPAVGGF
ncbi:hypothetical protein DFH11DRAFT_1549268 [Phellopilus nigrolimitatus]|nr:hypothetical protein DFH11DRAFT_1549268 [Phellopilus nigrolimitatus]